ncbi:O-acetyl-ADP-ribose deacetylase [Acrasis kona]|uniref:O-acetyl-ADP-ribose deacetylase n=1 Tax=Acrasis kona TaxID=1008807 RepID=A0AAW2YWF9_9EUKA
MLSPHTYRSSSIRKLLLTSANTTFKYSTKKERVSPTSPDFFMSEEERKRWRSRRKIFYSACAFGAIFTGYFIYKENENKDVSFGSRREDLKQTSSLGQPREIYKEFGEALVHRNHVIMGGSRLLNLDLCEGDLTRERSDAVVVSVPLSYLALGREVPVADKPLVVDESKLSSTLENVAARSRTPLKKMPVEEDNSSVMSSLVTNIKKLTTDTNEKESAVDPLLALNNVPTNITSSVTPYFNPFNPKYFHDQQMKDRVKKYGPLQPGDVFVVDAGSNYNCRKIVYVVPPEWTGGKNTTKEKYLLAELYKKIMMVADQNKFSSITFSTVAPKYPPHISAFIFFNTASNYSKIRDLDRIESAMTNIRMMATNDVLEPFCKEFDKRRRLGLYV